MAAPLTFPSPSRVGAQAIEAAKRASQNQFIFGIVSGLVAGGVAAARKKPLSIKANLVTAVVIGVGEGVLTREGWDSRLAVLTALGVALGMAPFTDLSALPRPRSESLPGFLRV